MDSVIQIKQDESLLEDIKHLFQSGNTDDALELLDAYLDEYPLDPQAELVKVELCLEARRAHAFVGEALLRLQHRTPGLPQLAELMKRTEARILEQLEAGRDLVRRGRLQQALECFQVAAALTLTDPTITMAAAQALLTEDADDHDLDAALDYDDLVAELLGTKGRREEQSKDERAKAVRQYLQLTLQRTTPTNPVFRRAARQLLAEFLSYGMAHEALDLLGRRGWSGTELENASAQIAALLLAKTLETALALLRAAQWRTATNLLDECVKTAPDVSAVRLLQAEAMLLAKRPTKALTAYRQALRLAGTKPETLSLTAIQPVWVAAQACQLTCASCRKLSAPAVDRCAYCGTPLAEHKLVLERYALGGAADSVVAQTGIAVIEAERGQRAQALKHLQIALNVVPDDHPAAPHLLGLRRKWTQELAAPLPVPSIAAGAIAAWRQSGVTADVVRKIEHTCKTTPSSWFEIPFRVRQELVQTLIQQRHLETARALLDAGFVDNPHRKTVLRLAGELAQQTAQQSHVLLVEGSLALQRGSPERAVDFADRILELCPHSLEARLLRANALMATKNPVGALADFRVVVDRASEPDTALAGRLGAVRALELTYEFEAAMALLDGLDNPETNAVRERLERRQRGEPVVLVQPAEYIVMHDTLSRSEDVTGYHGFFGVVVPAVGKPWNSTPAQWTEHIFAAGFEFVQVLAGLRHSVGDPVFALRFLSRPDPALPERGQLTVAFLVRVTAEHEDEVRPLALNLWQTFQTMLPLLHEHVYAFEPVADPTELRHLLAPFELVALSEIVRREDVPVHEGHGYAMYPFTAGSIDLHNFCWTLLRQPSPAMVSIQLLPTSLMAWERATLDRAIRGEENLVASGVGEMVQDNDGETVAQWWHSVSQWGPTQTNRQIVRSLRNSAYVLHVNVASSLGSSQLLPEMIAATLFGPMRELEGGLSGGYEIIHPNTIQEHQVARRNLETLDVERWVSSAATEGPERLRHLVGEREAALIFRLPVPGREGIPGMAVIDAKPIAPPTGMPLRGTVLGASVTRVRGRPLRITQAIDDRRRHAYVVGKTGTGKSTLLKNMALQDIDAGYGICVVDPHGDLVEDILARVPPHRAADVILFDPSDEERPIGLNLLEARDETAKHRVVTEFIGLLVRMYDPKQTGIVGPRFQHNVRHAMLTAMAVEGNTLIEVVRVLTDRHYVQAILPKIQDPVLKRYWTDQIAQTSDFHKSEILDYVVSKFSRFVGDSRIRNIIGQRQTTVDYREVMDQHRILLVNLSKGKIGPESAQFLGLLLVQGLLITALSRSDRAPDQRPDFYLYVDEFQNFATELFSTVLSEGRKYGIAVTAANQYLTQLTPDIREAIFGNVGSIVSFRLGTQDAAALAPEMYPALGADDLLNMPKFTACVKLLVDGVAARPFTMRTLPDTRQPDFTQAAAIRETSRLCYGRDAAAVTADILSRYEH